MYGLDKKCSMRSLVAVRERGRDVRALLRLRLVLTELIGEDRRARELRDRSPARCTTVVLDRVSRFCTIKRRTQLRCEAWRHEGSNASGVIAGVEIRLSGGAPVGTELSVGVASCPLKANDHGSASQTFAAARSAESKYRICAIVKGLHTAAMYRSHARSPTNATRSIFAQ